MFVAEVEGYYSAHGDDLRQRQIDEDHLAQQNMETQIAEDAHQNDTSCEGRGEKQYYVHTSVLLGPV